MQPKLSVHGVGRRDRFKTCFVLFYPVFALFHLISRCPLALKLGSRHFDGNEHN